MSGVVSSVAGVATASVDDLLFSGAGSILTALVQLAAELYTSREICQDLINSVADLQPQLESMLASGNATITKNALTKYDKLVRDIRSFLEDHIRSGKFARLTKHWTMKNRIKEFHVERVRIEAILQLEFIGQSAEHHAKLANMVEVVTEINERIELQQEKDHEDLKRMINSIPSNTAASSDETKRVVEALADLKHEIKSNAANYSNSELKLMKQLVLAGSKSHNIPREDLSLPVWYISRSDFRFKHGNPFAPGEFRSTYSGTLESGARVAVNVLNADAEDTNVRGKFISEVTTMSRLRDPHIVPFFGANHVGSPLVYVTAHAPNGNFRNYLRSHRGRFWQLFLDAARGLAYLHKYKIVHGNLKCSNLLVLADGTGVVSDFMFAFVRASSVLSLKDKPPTYYWTAPECLGVGENANPRFESDIYSLGICMVEAATDQRPYHDVTDDDDAIIDRICDGRLPNWTTHGGDEELQSNVMSLVAKMCPREYCDRAKLVEVIRILDGLAAKERVVRHRDATPCALCGKFSPSLQAENEPEQEFP